MAKKNKRTALLGKIHIQAKALGMSEDHYRDMLDDLTGKRSAATLTERQLAKVADHLTGLIAGPKQRQLDRNPGESPQMLKIKALLLAGGKSAAYGDGCARNICKVDRLEWVPEHDLYKIIAALMKQARREGWPVQEDK